MNFPTLFKSAKMNSLLKDKLYVSFITNICNVKFVLINNLSKPLLKILRLTKRRLMINNLKVEKLIICETKNKN